MEYSEPKIAMGLLAAFTIGHIGTIFAPQIASIIVIVLALVVYQKYIRKKEGI